METIQTGAVNIPGTIEELRMFCDRAEIPAERMRFMIGTNDETPMAYGIYKDGDDTVFYRNRMDGSRIVIYSGPNETYAVTKLYLELKKENAQRMAVHDFMNPNFDEFAEPLDVLMRRFIVRIVIRTAKAARSIRQTLHTMNRDGVAGAGMSWMGDASYFI